MRLHYRAVVIALLFAMTILFAPGAQATIHEIQVGNFFFSPLNTVVTQGDTVRWIWVSGSHSSTSNAGSPKAWDSGIHSALGGFEFDLEITAADPPGDYPYLCTVHPFSMLDTLRVVAAADPTVYTFLLDEEQANDCLGTGSNARGFGRAILSADSSELSIYVEHDVSGVSDAHIHSGAPCVSGGVSHGFTSPTSPIHETVPVTPGFLSDLIAGNLYVNIHSLTFPGGEIRGQIVQDPIKFIFPLDEAQAAAGAGTQSFSSGLAICELSGDSKQLSVDVTHDVASVNDSHIHLGDPGVSGGIVFGFANSASPINEAWDLDTTSILDLMRGDLYINIHSTAFPAGEIRGQIDREDLVLACLLDESQADAGNGTGSAATGFLVGKLSSDLRTFDIHCEHDVVNVSDGHIHLGAPGVSGAIQFGFGDFNSPIDETWVLAPGDLDNLLAGDLYVNIHSTAFPAGEIRGQLVLDLVHSFDFGLDESQADACAGTGSLATGTAQVRLRPGGSEMTIAVTHDVANVSDGHIHLGAECVSGGIQFGFSQFASPIEEFWYLTEDNVIDLFQKEHYVNIHSTAFPAGEIRGQIDVADCLCGDADNSGQFSIGDAVYTINFIFGGGPAPAQPCLGDADGNGQISIGDAVYIINFIFGGGPAPACP